MIKHAVRSAILQAATRLPRAQCPGHSREIVLLRPDHLGDVLFLTPALRRLRVRLPNVKITVAIGPWSEPVLAGNPNIDELLLLRFPGFTRSERSDPTQPYRMIRQWSRELQQRDPAAIVILRDDHWWGSLLAHTAGVPIRIGFDHPSHRSWLTHRVEIEHEHWVRRNARILDLAADVLTGEPSPERGTLQPTTDPLDWRVEPEDDRRAEDLLRQDGITSPFVCIHPGSGAPVKLWPAKRWAVVATNVSQRTGADIVITGSDGEIGLADQIIKESDAPMTSLAGRTNLRELGAIFGRATAVLGVDSGPLHLAVAVGTPSLHLYGPSDPVQFGPWGPTDRHLMIRAGLRCPRCGDLSVQRPAGAGCMLAITPEQVTDLAIRMLGRD